MVKEIPSEKFGSERGSDSASSVVVHHPKERSRGLVAFLIAIGLGTGALIGIALDPYVTSLGNSIDGVERSMSEKGNGQVVTAVVSDSLKAIDDKGTVVENNGITKSSIMTITAYSHETYLPQMQCLIDSLPVYCDGGEVTISGLPPGHHRFATLLPSNSGIMAETFDWNVLA